MVTPTISNTRLRGREDRGAADKSSAFAPAQEAGARERGCRRSGNGSCAVCRWFVGEDPPDCHVCGALSRSASCLSPPQGDDRFAGLQYSCSRKCFTKHLRLCFLSASGVRKPEKSRTPLFLKNETHHKKGNHHHEAQNLYRPPAGGHHALRTHRLRQSGRRRFQQRFNFLLRGHVSHLDSTITHYIV